NAAFKNSLDLVLSLSKSFLDLAKNIEPALPGLLLLGTISTVRAGTRYARGFVRGFTGKEGGPTKQGSIFDLLEEQNKGGGSDPKIKHLQSIDANTRAIQNLTNSVNAL